MKNTINKTLTAYKMIFTSVFPITRKEDHQEALQIFKEWRNKEDSPERRAHLRVWAILIREYEKKSSVIYKQLGSPIEMLRFRMDQMGINQKQLAELAFDSHQGRVSEVLNGKRRLTVKMIKTLSEVLNVAPKHLI